MFALDLQSKQLCTGTCTVCPDISQKNAVNPAAVCHSFGTPLLVGLLGVVGLAVAVGALALSSLTGSGAGGAASAPAEVKQLLDRVPEPLPVARKAQQAVTQVTSRGKTYSNRGVEKEGTKGLYLLALRNEKPGSILGCPNLQPPLTVHTVDNSAVDRTDVQCILV